MNKTDSLGAWNPTTAQRKVRDAVAEIFGVEPVELVGRGRRMPLVEYRHIAMWVVRECFPSLSYPMIGRLFGGRDHSTVIHGCTNICNRREREAEFRQMTDRLRGSFGMQQAGLVVDSEARAEVERLAAQLGETALRKAETRVTRRTIHRARAEFYAEINAYPEPKPHMLDIQLKGQAGCPRLDAKEIQRRRESVKRARRDYELDMLEQERVRYALPRRATALSEMVA